MTEAWDMMRSNLPAYLVAGLILATCIWVGMVSQFVLAFSGSGGSSDEAASWIFGIVGDILSYLALAGFYRMSINHVRTGSARFGDFFRCFDILPALLGATVIQVLAISVGTMLCCVPGLLLQGLWMFTTPLIVDQKMGPIAALKLSFKTLSPMLWMALLFDLAVNLVAAFGALGCLVALLFTYPLCFLGITLAYRDFFITSPNPPRVPPSYPTVPISNPGS